MPAVRDVVRFLNRELRTDRFGDSSNNGLQVENSGRLRRVVCGVDASLALFEEAARRKADLIVCHHGLSWGDSLKRITGLRRGRLAFLLGHDMALYASHLPLDAHPRHGNNAGLARALGLRTLQPFCEYHGQVIGLRGRLPRPLPFADFEALVARATGCRAPQSMAFGPPVVRTVGVVSGGAAPEVEQAGELGLDAYVSGEPGHCAWHVAREHAIHAVFAGHYATEVFGVRTLADLIRRRFKVPAEFVDLPSPY